MLATEIHVRAAIAQIDSLPDAKAAVRYRAIELPNTPHNPAKLCLAFADKQSQVNFLTAMTSIPFGTPLRTVPIKYEIATQAKLG